MVKRPFWIKRRLEIQGKMSVYFRIQKGAKNTLVLLLFMFL